MMTELFVQSGRGGVGEEIVNVVAETHRPIHLCRRPEKRGKEEGDQRTTRRVHHHTKNRL